MSHYPIENKVVNEVETNSSFTCKDESKSFGTKIVGMNASKRIIRFWFQYFIEIISFYSSGESKEKGAEAFRCMDLMY
jgi:hypothetical protein